MFGPKLRFLVATLLLFAWGIAWAGAATADEPDKRVALVIGNSAYQTTTALPNPKNDATAVGNTLKGMGFDTEVLIDVTKAAMDAAIRRFGDRLEGAGVGLFFYAGHGLQVNGQNYLVPVDAKLTKERDLEFESVDFGLVMHQMESTKRVNLIFLDACRDNPLANTLASNLGAKRSMVGRGLARIDAGAGTLISYSTREGTTAQDGDERNSPYTTALLRHMTTPGLDVALMLRQVREEVMTKTNQEQVPWEYGSLMGEFALVPAAARPDAPATPGPGPTATVPDALGAAELAFWDAIKTSANPADYQAYLETYPTGHFVALARVRARAQSDAVAMAAVPVPATPASSPSASPPLAPVPSGAVSSGAAPSGVPDDQARRQAAALNRVAELPFIVTQYALKALSYYDATVDGTPGPGSFRAIKAFQQSLGVRADGALSSEQTVTLIQKAAARGQAESQNTLGMMLASGLGVLQDEAAAVEWFWRAANQGNAFAKYNLAVMYRDGRGVTADRAKAVTLFREARSNGYQKADIALKELTR